MYEGSRGSSPGLVVKSKRNAPSEGRFPHSWMLLREVISVVVSCGRVVIYVLTSLGNSSPSWLLFSASPLSLRKKNCFYK